MGRPVSQQFKEVYNGGMRGAMLKQSLSAFCLFFAGSVHSSRSIREQMVRHSSLLITLVYRKL